MKNIISLLLLLALTTVGYLCMHKVQDQVKAMQWEISQALTTEQVIMNSVSFNAEKLDKTVRNLNEFKEQQQLFNKSQIAFDKCVQKRLNQFPFGYKPRG